MAGGKETPRQKMIGMMYLVLTALLAMNVSSTVIDKFLFINQSLERSVSEATSRNVVTINSIKKQVEDMGNRASDLKFATAADEVRAETAKVQNQLEEFKKKFVELTGGIEEGHEGDLTHMKGKTDYDRVGHYMMEEGGNHGIEMEALLNGYADFLSKKVGEPFGKIALNADEDEIYKADPNQKGKKFAQLAFENSPTPACLATVSEFQAQVSSYETRALDILKGKVGAKDLKFDKIVAMVKPESKIVAAGTKYIAEMFIAASASGISPTMTVNGSPIPVTSGMGKVEFMASAGDYDKEGLAKKTFQASITVPTPGGGDTTYSNTIDYYVAKPVIQIQSASVQALYLNCGNDLDVQVPALGTTYNPSFTAKGASVVPGKQRGQVTVVPNAAEVVLNVASNGNAIGSQNFKVRRIPSPEIKALIGQKEADSKTGIPANTAQINLRAVSDESFQQFLPKDARFKVSQADVYLVRSGQSVGQIKAGSEVNLRQLSGARPGDNLVIEIKKVQRANFRDEVEDFNNFAPRIISIPLR